MTNVNNNNEMELIAKVQASGSLVSKTRDTLAFKADTNKPDEGFIFAPQKKEIYNINELKKAVDVDVVELVPESPETELDLVPRPLYEEALESLSIALDTIEVQTETIATLEGRITELESEIETLKEEIDNEKLLRVLSEENASNLREEILIITNDVQSSLQRSIIEGIEKSALEAKTEGLIAQVEALKDEVADLNTELDRKDSELLGKEAAIEAGAKAGLDITLLVINKLDDEGQDLLYRERNNGNSQKWFNGPEIEVYNFTSQNLTITCTQSGVGWIKQTNASKVLKDAPLIFTLNANERKRFTFQAKGDVRKPGGDTEYRGRLEFKTTNGVTSLTTGLQKQVGQKWANRKVTITT